MPEGTGQCSYQQYFWVLMVLFGFHLFKENFGNFHILQFVSIFYGRLTVIMVLVGFHGCSRQFCGFGLVSGKIWPSETILRPHNSNRSHLAKWLFKVVLWFWVGFWQNLAIRNHFKALQFQPKPCQPWASYFQITQNLIKSRNYHYLSVHSHLLVSKQTVCKRIFCSNLTQKSPTPLANPSHDTLIFGLFP